VFRDTQIFMIVSKNLYISTSIFAAGLEPATIRLYYRDFRLSTHPPFMIIFDFSRTLVKIVKQEMKPHWYPDKYPDNLLSIKRISG